MTSKSQDLMSSKVRSLLDQFLEGRSDGFKSKVYQLVIQYGWDVNDPSFAILVSTGQMEVLLTQFPEQFESVFVDLMQKAQLQFEGQQQWWAERQEELESCIQGMEVQQSLAIEKLQTKIGTFQENITQQRGWAVDEVKAVLSVSKGERDQFQAEMQKRLRRDEQQFIQEAKDQGLALARKAVSLAKQRALDRMLWTGGLVGGFMATFGILIGSTLLSWGQKQFTELPRAMDLWKWNQGFYRECKKQERTTCNFTIVEPKE